MSNATFVPAAPASQRARSAPEPSSSSSTRNAPSVERGVLVRGCSASENGGIAWGARGTRRLGPRSATRGSPRAAASSAARHVTSVLLFGVAVCAAAYGVSYAYMLHYLVNVVVLWLVVVHSTTDTDTSMRASTTRAQQPHPRRWRDRSKTRSKPASTGWIALPCSWKRWRVVRLAQDAQKTPPHFLQCCCMAE